MMYHKEERERSLPRLSPYLPGRKAVNALAAGAEPDAALERIAGTGRPGQIR